MVVYYVEGDGGHLMGEELGDQKFRTVVRGSCVSYHMPWEDICKEMQEHGDDRSLGQLPRPQEALKYMLRVYVRVNGLDLKKHLRQIQVRPFVIVALLDFLIERNHEAFRGKGLAVDLRQQMRAAVAKEYPGEDEVPKELWECLAATMEEETQRKAYQVQIHDVKNATPGDGGTTLEACLDNLRPQSVCLDKSATSCVDPEARRRAALVRSGVLPVEIKSKELTQFHSKYFSQALPLVIPRMVSGPDFFPARPWRRIHEDSPKVSAPQFCAAFARRAEAQCRTDWSALSIIRSVTYKFVAEHTMTTVAPIIGRNNRANPGRTKELIEAAEKLYKQLHEGFIGRGVHRVPIGGNTTLLPRAVGLSPLEKKLAWGQHFLARHMPGSQQLRQLMGHVQFGARIQYGDCLFFTISPNEQHSALVLRLSRFRRNDPFVIHGSPFFWQSTRGPQRCSHCKRMK